MATVLRHSNHTEQRILLQGVKWETYESLLEDLVDRTTPRLVFDQGTLEIMSPTAEHEEYNRTLALLVEIIAEETGVDVRRLGSTTFKREDLHKGFEPDSCFYIQSLAAISDKNHLDLLIDPPPDLVIEIDITSSSLDRFSIFSQVGVPEVWRYLDNRVQVFTLDTGHYIEVDHSLALSFVTSAILTRFVQQSRAIKSTEWLRKVRQWIRSENDAE